MLRIWYLAVIAGTLGLITNSNANAQGISTPIAVSAMSDADRFTARLPDEAGLAQPTRIELDLPRSALAIRACGSHENRSGFEDILVNSGRKVGCSEARAISAKGMHQTIEFYPLDIGPLRVSIMVIYADRHFAAQLYDLSVRPSARDIKRFSLNQGLPEMAIVLGCDEQSSRTWLDPEVEYETLKYPLHLYNSEEIPLSVDQPDDPIVRVDPSGLVHGLRPGKAIITGSFDGVTDHATVHVYPKPPSKTCH